MAHDSLPLQVDDPTAAGLDPARWQIVHDLISGWCEAGEIPAAAVMVGRHGKTTGPRLFGRRSPLPDAPPIGDDAIFLIASITKPIVAMGVLLLAERGKLALDDRVEAYVPRFGREGKHAVTIRHLLTHTSGLPDMLPENVELRAQGAPLAAFVDGTCRVPLAFPPGRGVQYQSMGFAMLGEIIGQVSGKTCAQFLKHEFFDPLGMRDTALGATDDWFTGREPKAARIAEIRLPDEQRQASGWNWNTEYWRKLGAPWGGLLTTPSDLARYAEMLLGAGTYGKARILSPLAVAAATRNQLDAMREVPADDRRYRPWGLGWRLNWAAHSANFGDFLGPRTYGHWGATGTVMWLDPDSHSYAILLTTQPQEPAGSLLARASNAIAAAFM